MSALRVSDALNTQGLVLKILCAVHTFSFLASFTEIYTHSVLFKHKMTCNINNGDLR